ncbi:MAG: hypothetical protein ACOY4K_03620 [Pseudomonadota bacterium]
MSCDAVAFAAVLFLASSEPGAAVPAPAVAAEAPPLAREPLFADIVKRADALKARVDVWKGVEGPLPGYADFRGEVEVLARLDMQAHRLLAERGTDGDLKCILRGIAQDLPARLKEVETAADRRARDQALKEMFWLLRDNVEVIVTPPTVTSGADA